MAIFAQRAFSAFRPGGVKLHAGAPVIEPGHGRGGFQGARRGRRDASRRGRARRRQGRRRRRRRWSPGRAKYGIQSTIHTGGPSIPGSGLIGADVVLEADTDVIGHVNGGHTALPDARMFAASARAAGAALEPVHNGNEQRRALHAAHGAREMGQLERVILGTDGPAGSGVQPLGILRMVAMLALARRGSGRDRPSASPPATPRGCAASIAG